VDNKQSDNYIKNIGVNMNGKQITYDSIKHISGPVPQLIGFTHESIGKYGDEILCRFADDKIRSLLDGGWISKSDAAALACGNHIIRVEPPWWHWHGNDPVNFKTLGAGNYDKFYELCKRMDDSGYYVLACIYGSHFEKAYFARGFENLLSDIAGEPEYAQRLLDRIIDKNMVMLENFIDRAVVDGVLLGSDWGSQRGLLMSPNAWRELIKPGELREYELIRAAGKHIWIHSCGDITEILPDLCEMGVDVLNPVQPECMDIYEHKNKYGKQLTFWGGISTQRTLPFGSPDEVRHETRKIIEVLSDGGGYIASPSQELQDDVPLDNVMAMIEVIKERGNKPWIMTL